MEIKRREILFSIIIIALMLTAGFFIKGNVEEWTMEKNEKLFKAVKLTEPEQFDYGLQTDIGNVVAEGMVATDAPVSLPELRNEYMFVEKITERYTRHVEYYTDSEGKRRTRTRYSWDYIDGYTLQAAEITFMEQKLKGKMVRFYGNREIDLEKEVNPQDRSKISGGYLYERKRISNNVGDLRFKYQAIPIEFKGILIGKAKDGQVIGLERKKVEIHKDETIKSYMKALEKRAERNGMIFMVIWILVTIGIVIAFYVARNRWLD